MTEMRSAARVVICIDKGDYSRRPISLQETANFRNSYFLPHFSLRSPIFDVICPSCKQPLFPQTTQKCRG